jgi:hypothetical protein
MIKKMKNDRNLGKGHEKSISEELKHKGAGHGDTCL